MIEERYPLLCPFPKPKGILVHFFDWLGLKRYTNLPERHLGKRNEKEGLIAPQQTSFNGFVNRRQEIFIHSMMLLSVGGIMKFDFRKELEELKHLESQARDTGIEMYDKLADIQRSLLMSYKGMTRELVVAALAKDRAFQQKVMDLIEKKDVEEIHNLWTKYCKGR